VLLSQDLSVAQRLFDASTSASVNEFAIGVPRARRLKRSHEL
jgi:hypothetical protein